MEKMEHEDAVETARIWDLGGPEEEGSEQEEDIELDLLRGMNEMGWPSVTEE